MPFIYTFQYIYSIMKPQNYRARWSRSSIASKEIKHSFCYLSISLSYFCTVIFFLSCLSYFHCHPPPRMFSSHSYPFLYWTWFPEGTTYVTGWISKHSSFWLCRALLWGSASETEHKCEQLVSMLACQLKHSQCI